MNLIGLPETVNTTGEKDQWYHYQGILGESSETDGHVRLVVVVLHGLRSSVSPQGDILVREQAGCSDEERGRKQLASEALVTGARAIPVEVLLSCGGHYNYNEVG